MKSVIAEKFDDFNINIKKIVIAHKFTYDVTSVYTCAQGRKSYGLVYLLSGELKYLFSNGRFLHLHKGDFILLKPMDAYTVTCPKLCQHYTVNFQISSIEGKLIKPLFRSSSPTIIAQRSSEHYQIDILDELCALWKQKNAGYQMQATSLLYKLLYYFLRSQLSLYNNNDKYTKVLPAKEYLENHWNSNLSLQILADSCNISLSHFRHLFFDVFSMTPIAYRDSLRLLNAKDYLSQEHYTISEIAYKCGFEDINYFSRFFKKHTGLSPRDFRLKQYDI